MRFTKILILVLWCLLSGLEVIAQRSKVTHSKTRNYSNYNSLKMSRAKSRIVCPIFEDTGYPYQGLGIKLGDPFAVTYKYYPNKHIGIVADFGKSASGLYSRYYSEVFEEYTQQDTVPPTDRVDYYSHKVNSDWVGEIKVLYHINAEKISPGLQVYTGLGWELRSLDITYNYQVLSEGKILAIDRNRFTQGIEGVLGIEYSYFKLPISAFMELEYYVDVHKDPGWRKVQGGVGLRYIF